MDLQTCRRANISIDNGCRDEGRTHVVAELEHLPERCMHLLRTELTPVAGEETKRSAVSDGNISFSTYGSKPDPG